MRSAWVAFALIALLTLPNLSLSVMTQPAPWISQSIVTQYVNNLIDTYNAKVTATYGLHPDFTITDNFKLYHASDHSFNVTVVRYNDSSNIAIGFVFVPIISPAPVIVIDNTATVCELTYPICIPFAPNNDLGFAVRQSAYNGSRGAGYGPFIWIANATTLFADPLVSSAEAADSLFRNDQKAVPSSDALTAFLTWFNDNLLIKTIVTIFGGLGAFVLIFFGFLRNRGRRKRVRKKKFQH